MEFNVLSPELESLYERRFEEGYNLSIDPKYNRWIKKKYPELSTADQPSHSGYAEPVMDAVEPVEKEVEFDVLSPELESLYE